MPGGVQGLDRYAYVNNNPLKYTDPSGNMWCSGDGHCGGGDYSNSTQDILDVSHMNVEKLDRSEIFVVTRAAQAIANASGAVSNSMSSWEAFRFIYINGGRNLYFKYWQGNESKYTYCQAQISSGGELYISMPSNLFSLNYPRPFASSTTIAIRNLVHEFGHEFQKSIALYENTTQYETYLIDEYSKVSAIFTRKDYGTRSSDWGGFAGGRNSWQFSLPDQVGYPVEVIADMFLGFTYNTWGTSNLAAQRSAWMTNIMSYYINSIK